jgi:hypothetical protein
MRDEPPHVADLGASPALSQSRENGPWSAALSAGAIIRFSSD